MSSGITNIEDETASRRDIKLFGIPIIQTKCQADSYFYGIVSGITCGLITYLFTSKGRMSSHVGAGSCAITTLCYAYYCLNQDYEMAKQMKLVRKAMYEASTIKSVDKKLNELSEDNTESV